MGMNGKKWIVGAVVGLGLMGLSACKEEPSIKQYRVQKAPSSPAPLESTVTAPSGLPFTWSVPDGWREGKASSMRVASYEAPLNGETGDFSLIRLSGAAGGIAANVNRWRGQIGLGPVSSEEISHITQAAKTAQGVPYLLVTLINPDNPANAIIAAIIQRSDFVLFAKLTASRTGVESAQSSFKAFCDSLTFTSR